MSQTDPDPVATTQPSLLATLRTLALPRSARLSRDGVAFARIWPDLATVPGLLISPLQEFWLFQAARALPNTATIVEIGSFKGRSTSALAYGCRGTERHVYALDTFDGNDNDFDTRGFRAEFDANIARGGLTDYVTAVPGRSLETAAHWDRPIDLLFIDGSHDFDDVVADFHGFVRHVRPGGLVAVHDVLPTWEGVDRAWREVIAPELIATGNCATLAYGRVPS